MWENLAGNHAAPVQRKVCVFHTQSSKENSNSYFTPPEQIHNLSFRMSIYLPVPLLQATATTSSDAAKRYRTVLQEHTPVLLQRGEYLRSVGGCTRAYRGGWLPGVTNVVFSSPLLQRGDTLAVKLVVISFQTSSTAAPSPS